MSSPTLLRRHGPAVIRLARDRAAWLWAWSWRHRRWLAGSLVIAALLSMVGSTRSAVQVLALGMAPGLVACCWAGLAPRSYELLLARPTRRLYWWWFARCRWLRLARVCGLADRQVVRTRLTEHGHRDVTRWTAPRLVRVRTRPHAVELRIRARAGQTLAELETGAERLATTFGAVAHRVWPVSGATLVVQLVMLDALTDPVEASEPDPYALSESVHLGRTQSAGKWRLQMRGRHTLVAGCSGSGKGSVLWGICCGLAPAVRADVARLWGIDLKRGVELAMGEGLFSTRAYTPTDAVDVLRALMRVIDERGHRMTGRTRLHEPIVGDPLHVLVIDELAALTAYADLEVRREANRLLAEILTQGRALGVVVVACVQDPRKDVVAMRGLFTQTVALRLRSAEETVMVLGDGMSHLAPAHRISPSYPGTAWVLDDTGAADRVRADFWPDHLIRDLAQRYATEVRHDTAPAVADDAPSPVKAASESTRKPRAPRKPRTPRRSPESDQPGSGSEDGLGVEGAA